MTAPDWLWSLIGGGLSGIGTLAVASFTRLGDRFSEYLVSRQVAAFRHGLETQIEQLKARLAHVGDRGTRSNELEYKAIIAAWEQFVDAYLATHNCIIRYYEHPDFTLMDDTKIRQYLQTRDFSEVQQDQVCGAQDKNRIFRKIIEWRLIAKASGAIFDARSVLRKQGIFIPKALEDDFEKALKLFSAAQVQMGIELDHGRIGELTDVQAFSKDGPLQYENIKEKVRQRVTAALSAGADPV
jgi:hypothetical protein